MSGFATRLLGNVIIFSLPGWAISFRIQPLRLLHLLSLPAAAALSSHRARSRRELGRQATCCNQRLMEAEVCLVLDLAAAFFHVFASLAALIVEGSIT